MIISKLTKKLLKPLRFFWVIGFLPFVLLIKYIRSALRDKKDLFTRKRPLKEFLYVSFLLFFLFPLWFLGYVSALIVLDAVFLNNKITSNDTAFRPSYKPPQANIKADEIFELTNGERVKAGLKPLRRNEKLDQAALERAQKIIEFGEFSHEATKSGVTYIDAIGQANYWNTTKGENLAEGQFSSSQVMVGWMGSNAHRENILNPQFQDIGVATYEGKLNGRKSIVSVQLFGGYVPPNYSQADIDSWKSARTGLINYLPSWENARSFGSQYENNKSDYERIISIFKQRIDIANRIIPRMEANQYFTSDENKLIELDKALYQEAENLANKLNKR